MAPRGTARKIASATPRYLEIARDIERAILSGRWPPGHRIPPETELTGRYACARMTVNRALSSLVASGLIERRRRLGSFVAMPDQQSAILELRDLKDEIVARGSTYRYRLLSRALGRASAQESEKHGLPKNAPVLRIKALHSASDTPFALEERLINVGEVPRAAEESFTHISGGAWLIAHVPWTEAEHRISAASATAFEANKLQIRTRSACLVIERKTWRLSRTITHVRLIFPETMHHVMARFTPRQN
jgi:GntR family transcriptional regulator, histidine utilization repressor